MVVDKQIMPSCKNFRFDTLAQPHTSTMIVSNSITVTNTPYSFQRNVNDESRSVIGNRLPESLFSFTFRGFTFWKSISLSYRCEGLDLSVSVIAFVYKSLVLWIIIRLVRFSVPACMIYCLENEDISPIVPLVVWCPTLIEHVKFKIRWTLLHYGSLFYYTLSCDLNYMPPEIIHCHSCVKYSSLTNATKIERFFAQLNISLCLPWCDVCNVSNHEAIIIL
jgi:hypothetical protein